MSTSFEISSEISEKFHFMEVYLPDPILANSYCPLLYHFSFVFYVFDYGNEVTARFTNINPCKNSSNCNLQQNFLKFCV